MPPPTVVNVFGLNPVYAWTDEKTKETQDPIMGIELELENIRNWQDWEFDPFIRKEDGSLRNNGSEFVSRPVHAADLVRFVELFYKKNKVNKAHISERCSVHVHVNCQDMTVDQVASMCKVYQVVEKLLFDFIGDDRDKSIFCVPWHQTNITAREVFREPIKPGNFKAWYKYTALNLLPLFSYGTLEFRHMAGQPTVEPIVQWVNILKHLRNFAVENTPSEVQNILIGLNTTSQYDMLVDRVFKDTAPLLKKDNYKTFLEEGVLALKYMLFDNFHPPQAKPLGNTYFVEQDAQRIQEMTEQFRARQVELNRVRQTGGGEIRGGVIDDIIRPQPVPAAEWLRTAAEPFRPAVQPAPRAEPPRPRAPANARRRP